MPPYWRAFLSEHRLADSEFIWNDKSGGIDCERQIRIFSERESRRETEETYPGVIVVADGFHPVGDDLCPSGDLYFINERDGAGGALYKIYHDSVIDENYRKEDAIITVLADYRELLKHQKTKLAK
jgi:hypothetical protein